NHLTGKRLYDWQLIGESAEPVSTSGGIRLLPDTTIDEAPDFDLVIVVAGINVKENTHPKTVKWLSSISRKTPLMGGICTAPLVLAQAGLLDGYSCSAHWECLAALQEEFQQVYCNNHLFTFDRDRITCTGGDVPLHMMIHLVASHHGQSLGNGISDMFVCDRVRDSHEPQRLRMESQLFVNQPKLSNAVQLMEANIEEPIELTEVAQYSGISRRQLERLFLNFIGVTPSRFYLKLRLERAKQLLRQTSCSIVEIATMCGFVSAPHFSRSYRKYMGCSPKSERAQHSTLGSSVILSEEDAGLVPTGSSISLERARAESSFGSVQD
ncbi:MAG: GlxA family transcriptional regulator, partial [Gammaproteobacteria bacterium]|nr:GlxA family transcriptional regulator [Gammaproteobacteria bacterium]